MRPLRIMNLQTPARLYAVTEAESAYGGRTFTAHLAGTIWGDFKPDAPALQSTSEGDAYLLQEADFICRSSQGIARGGRLQIKGFDWKIVSLAEDADGAVRLRLERVHP